MAKVNLASMSVDALLKLRDSIGHILGQRADELKSQLRRDMSIRKLFNKEITSHISIVDADVAAYYNRNKAEFNLAEPRVHMAQITSFMS